MPQGELKTANQANRTFTILAPYQPRFTLTDGQVAILHPTNKLQNERKWELDLHMVANENHTHPDAVLAALTDLNKPEKNENLDAAREITVFGGCFHNFTEKDIQRLQLLAQNPPRYLVFEGDVSATSWDTEYKKRYFNGIVNQLKNAVDQFADNPNSLLDHEIKPLDQSQAEKEKWTVRDAYILLHTFLAQKAGLNEDEVTEYIESLTKDPEKLATDVITMVKLNNSGMYIGTCDPRIREASFLDYKPNAEKFFQALVPFLTNGFTEVIIVHGNEDGDLSLEVRAGTDDKAAELFKKAFKTTDYIEKEAEKLTVQDRLRVVKTLDVIETKSHALVCLPYFEILYWNEKTEEEKTAFIQKIAAAQRKGLPIIAVHHQEMDVYLHNPSQTMNPDRSRVRANMADIVAQISKYIDIFTHPHQHDPLPFPEHARDALYFVDKHGHVVEEAKPSNAVPVKYLPRGEFGVMYTYGDAKLNLNYPPLIYSLSHPLVQ